MYFQADNPDSWIVGYFIRDTNKPYFVYILRSLSRDHFYIGVAENVTVRLTEHNQGLSRYTKNRGPWKLVHSEQYPNLSLARRRENHLKRQKGGKGFFKALGMDYIKNSKGS